MLKSKLLDLLALLMVIGLAVSGFLIYYNYLLPKAQIGKHMIRLEIADDPQERYQGLSNRVELPANTGMLFIFDEYEPRTFVMRHMNFPLDIIWIRDNQVIGYCQDMPAPELHQHPKTCSSNTEVNLVLEVNAGFVDKYDIQVGDVFKY